MPNPPNEEQIQEVATEFGVHPSFVEKDWYVVQLIQYIQRLKDQNITPIFSGGTCLSRCYQSFKRFSEDIDFKVTVDGATNCNTRRQIRQAIIAFIQKHDTYALKNERCEINNNGRIVTFYIQYPKWFTSTGSLRPDIKLDIYFEHPELSPETHPIHSLLTEAAQSEPEAHICCLNLVEIAANKLSGLIWRVASAEKYEPRDLRHLHDLASLEKQLAHSKVFNTLS